MRGTDNGRDRGQCWNLREHLGADRVLYGSDLPIRENSVTIGRILGAKISAADKQKLLFGNTARLLKLNLK